EFTPGRDLGVQLHGKVLENSLTWKLGFFNGAVDGYNGAASTNTGNSFDLAASLFATPFKKSETEALRGLGFGIAGSWGKHKGDAAFRVRTTTRADVARSNDLTDNG